MNGPEQMEQIPVGKSGEQAIFLRDIAEWKQGTSVGEYDRINQQRFITVTANLYRKDLEVPWRTLIRALPDLAHCRRA